MTLDEAVSVIAQYGMATDLDTDFQTSSKLCAKRNEATRVLNQAIAAIEGVQYALWGDCETGKITNADKSWDGDTLNSISDSLIENGFGPVSAEG